MIDEIKNVVEKSTTCEQKKPNVLKLKLKQPGSENKPQAVEEKPRPKQETPKPVVQELTYSQHLAREKAEKEATIKIAEAAVQTPTLRGTPQIVKPQIIDRPADRSMNRLDSSLQKPFRPVARTTTFNRSFDRQNSSDGQNREYRPRTYEQRPYDPNRSQSGGEHRPGGFSGPRSPRPRPEGGYQHPGGSYQRPDGTRLSRASSGATEFGARPSFSRSGDRQNSPGGSFSRSGDRQNSPGGSFNRSGDRQNSPGGSFQQPGGQNSLGGYAPRTGDRRPQASKTGDRPGGFRQRPGGAAPLRSFDRQNSPGGSFSRPGDRQNSPGGSFNRPGDRQNSFGNSLNRTSGGAAPFIPDTRRGLGTTFDPDRARKKRTTDYDDNSRTQRNSLKENDQSINVTDFVGRIDAGHLESHMFRDAFVAHKKRDKQKTDALFIKRNIEIAGPMSIKDIAAKMAMRSSQVIAIARKAGLNANEKENVAEDILHIIVEECGHTPIRIDEKNKAQLEFPVQNIDTAKAVARPPVVVVVGHVDHGKTSLLDRIRKSNIAKKEAGGITQNIGAYQVHTKEGAITFIDTPGHEAFTSMRSRGVQTTDIAILVVSAEESIKPQTIEAIAHIKSADVPIIVAITKSDLHTANIERVKTDLLAHEIVVEEYGGQVACIPVSAVTGENIDKLLHAILLQAEIMELKANLEIEARGVVLESKINSKIGAVATLLVQQGTLKKAFCVAHVSSGKIKMMHDAQGNAVSEAKPGMPVEVIGFDLPPPAGAQFAQISDIKLASDILDARRIKNDQETKSAGLSMSFETFVTNPNPSINLILRADTQGSLEALKLALAKLNSSSAENKFVFAGVGAIKESDIDLAAISNAYIVGFNTKSNAALKKAASDKKIKLIENEIIYHIVDEVEKELLGLIKPEEVEVLLGTARVQQVFSSSKLGNIAGCVVTSGIMKNGMIAKVMRGEKLITTTKIASLKRNKDDAKEVNNGLECGIVLAHFNEVAAGDEIQCYKIEFVS